jgi:hypothetical protein
MIMCRESFCFFLQKEALVLFGNPGRAQKNQETGG